MTDRGTVTALVLACCCVVIALEWGSRVVLPRLSPGAARSDREFGQAFAPEPAGRKTVILAGNSLLDAGVKMDALRIGVGPRVEVRRLMVADTTYYDWYFAAKRLLAEGARFDYFILMLSPRQVVSAGIHGDESASQMIGWRDIPEVVRLAGAGRDQVMSMYLANVSRFWGMRVSLRQGVLERTLPSAGSLAPLFAPAAQPAPLNPREIERVATERFAALRQVIDHGRGRLVIVVPPSLGGNDPVEALEESGQRCGVRVLVPIRPGRLDATDFKDGFHLDRSGASKFTPALARALEAVLSD